MLLKNVSDFNIRSLTVILILKRIILVGYEFVMYKFDIFYHKVSKIYKISRGVKPKLRDINCKLSGSTTKG